MLAQRASPLLFGSCIRENAVLNCLGLLASLGNSVVSHLIPASSVLRFRSPSHASLPVLGISQVPSSSTVVLLVLHVCSLFLQSGIGTPFAALPVVSPRHSLQRIVCWRLRFLMWFLHKPRCATLRLFPNVDVHRDQLLHVFLRAVFPGPCLCELSKVRFGMETVWTLCCPRTRLLVLRTQTSPEYC